MFNKEEKKVAEELTSSSNNIGKGTTLDGNLEAYGNIRVEGRVLGNVKTKSKVALGHSSHVEGNILAQNAEVEGEVKGTLETTELLVLKSTAVVHGDIITNKLMVEAGAKFNGGCRMGASTKEIKIGENGQSKEAVRESEVKTA